MCNISQGVYLKGELKAKQETAITLKSMGMVVENIAKAVHVSEATVRQWLENKEPGRA